MAAILKLRRGTSIPSLQQSELFYHSSLNTLVVGDGSNSHILLKSGSNTVNTVDISGTVSASYIHVTNDITIKGNIILGDEIANDNITINAELSGSLIPDADNTHDLGSNSKKYKNLYINSLPGTNIVSSSAQISGYNSFLEINGDNVVSSSAQISGYNSFLEINGDNVVSSSAQISGYNKFLEINGDNVVSSSAQIDSLGFLKVNGDNVFSSSVQVNANTITNFDSNVKDKLNIEDVISGSSQILDGSNIVSSSAQISGYDVFLEKDGNNVVSSSAQISGYDKFLEKDGDNVFSSSVQVNANTITNFDSNVKTKLNDDNVHSGSFLGTATTANLSENTNLYYTDTRVKSKLNTEGVLSGSSQLTTEFDSRYLNTNGDNVFSSSVQVNANTITNFDSNVKSKMNSDGVISGSSQLDNVFLEINGDNVVSSSAQISGYNKFLEINGDNVVSGSTQVNSLFEGTAVSTSLDSRLDSLEGDIHTHTNKTELDTINQNLSTTSNVTFNTGSFTGDVTITGDFTVLGSATEISSTELRIEDKLITVASGSTDSAAADGAGIEIDGAGVSLQWDHNTTSFVLDAKVSSSVGFKGEGGELTGIDTDQVTEGSNLYYTDTRVKTKLNTETVISGSSQLTSTFDIRYLEINGDNVVSSSAQIDIHSTDGYAANEHIDHSTISVGSGKGLTGGGTIDTNRSITLDTGSLHFTDGVKTKLNTETVISGSSQVSLSSVSGYSSSEHFTQGNITTVGTVTSGDVSAILPSGLVSGSAFSSPSQGTVRATINGVNTDVDTGLQTGDNPIFQGLTLQNLNTLGTGQQTTLISGSGGTIGKRVLGTAAFFNVSASIADDPNSIPTTKAVNDALISAGAGDITEVNPSSIFSDSTTGLIHLSTGTEVGGTKGVQGNIHIAISTGSAHFTQGVEKALPSGLVSASAQILDGSNIISSSEQIDDFLFNIDGLVSSSTQISGYDVFLEKNGDSVFSGSSQVDVSQTTNYSSINQYSDTKVKTKLNTETVISGSSQVDYDSIQNQPTTITSPQITKLAFISVTQSVDLDTLEINVGNNTNKVGYTDALVKTKLNTEGVISGSSQFIDGSGIVSSSAQISGYDVFLEKNGDGVFSGSSQVDADSVQNFDSNVLTKLNAEGVFSGSTQVNADSITNFDSNVKAKLNTETVISGSSQVSLSSVTGYSSTEHFTQGNITTVGTVTSGDVSAILPSGVISGSTQLTSVYLEINGDNVVSGSTQINSLFGGTSVSSSLDSRIVSLESDIHTHANKTNLDTINQNLATTNNVVFADGDFTGDVQINGSLVVQGSATELQVSELRIEDKLITVASGSANSTAANGGGIEIDRGSDTNASILWNHTDTRFDINNGIHVTGTIKATDDIIAFASSDKRLKDNIKPIPWALDKINKIGGYSFDWNEDRQDIYKGTDIGVIAQEIEEVLPELVQTRENGYKAVKYDKLVSLLIEGIKDLSKQVEELKNK
jgi:hypothetical protein